MKPDGDPLAAHRDRVMYTSSLAGMVCLLPFAVNDFIKGRELLGAAILCVVIGLAVDALAIRLKKKPPMPFAFLLLPAAAAITLSLRTQGVIGAFWCYPLVLFFHFVLSRAMANACSLALLVEASYMVYRYIGSGVALRFFVSLLLTIVIINLTLNVIRDLQAKLVEQTITDSLTGAFNRRHMEVRLSEAIEEGRRRGAPASLLMMDLDHFKTINDHFGHATGDDVLKGFVDLVHNRARRLDLLFRSGGEEFILLLPNTPESDALKLAEALRSSVEHAELLKGISVKVSIGVAGLDPSQSRDAWLKQVDEALYAAKRGGRNRVAAAKSPGPS